MPTREEIFESLRQNPQVSVLIIGAGVNGIGLFRDLAIQGVDVLIVDKADFCSGASAASSHMVHGGLRYLENAEFRLVREALTERNRLLQNAPHYVKPLPTTIPIFKRFSGFLNAPLKFLRLRNQPGERGSIIIKLGLMMYDAFTRGQQTLPKHRFFSRKASLETRPQLNPDIVATAQYYDAWMPYPERICMEMILDAEAALPQARAVNYLAAEKYLAGGLIELRDLVTDKIVTVKPKIVVNASGPWIDFTNSALERRTTYIGGTKGSHVVVDHKELHEATQGNEMFFENKDGRITLFFPLLDKVLMGTTDIPIKNPDEARCTDEEIDYILSAARIVFPNIKVEREHIVFTFTGVRPLPSSSAATAGQISRDHSIYEIEPGDGIEFPILALVGGKWTTFRAFAEEATDKVLKRLEMSRVASTEKLSIGGGRDYPKGDVEREQWLTDLRQETNLPHERVQPLFERYGTRAREITQFILIEQDEMLKNHPNYSKREIIFLATNEKIVHLDDLILRRSLMGMLGEVNGGLLEELASILAETLGWSDVQKSQEIERTIQILQDKHGVSPKRLQVKA